MIPLNYKFLRKKDIMGVSLQMSDIVTDVTYPITKIEKFSEADKYSRKHPYSSVKREQAIIYTSTSVVGIESGMKLKVEGTNQGLADGVFEIVSMDIHNNKFIVSMPKAVNQASSGGTATTYGTARMNETTIPGVIVRNNDGEDLFNSYVLSGSFLYKKENEETMINLTITNIDATNSITSTHVYYSIDGISWLDFPTAVTGGTVAPGNSFSHLIGFPMRCYLKLDVVSAGAYYYVIGR